MEDPEILLKPDGVVDELRIVEDELIINGLLFIDMDGSEDGDLGDVDRLWVDKLRLVVGFKNEENRGDFSFLSFDSFGRSLRGCLDKEDIRRLAAAIGPIDRQSVKELVLL